ncbi:SusC/RagA family TonB-linked outer membrane protein [Sunxiuqinia sp. A32]|uniref:SusC/RagA family TonB-linked outer membrane protein n=1 Tax=Sunxiuqinia sp. A32 TaxID=3461496 RepID=UPI004045F48E
MKKIRPYCSHVKMQSTRLFALKAIGIFSFIFLSHVDVIAGNNWNKFFSDPIRNLIPEKAESLQPQTIKGRIVDKNGDPLPGANVIIEGTYGGAISDADGDFTIEAEIGDKLVFSFIGMEKQEVKYTGQKDLVVTLQDKTDELDEVTVVAFGKQKKESVISSISTISPKDLKIPSSNLTSAFAGRIAGMISYQTTGEPDADNAQFFIRGVTTFGTGKKDPLILIDGVEMSTGELSRLTPDDIGSFSIMKDANATALYGARGANGVILVTTKEGREGKAKISFRMERAFSQPTEELDFVDPINFMKLHNEAVVTRGDINLPYSKKKIDYTERGIDPLRYPQVDWDDMLFKNGTFNQRYNLNISGGGKVANYYIAAKYTNDKGILKNDSRQNYDNNISADKYSLRSNVNVFLSQTTKITVRLNGDFDTYSGPLVSGSDLYKKVLNASPVYFLPYYEPDEANIYTKNILFGNYDTGNYLNPYAEMVKGYKSKDRSNMYAQFEVNQDLDFLTEGLSVRGLFNISRYSLLEIKRQYNPFWYNVAETPDPDDYVLTNLNPDGGTDYLNYQPGTRELVSTMYVEGAVNYKKKIKEKNSISGLLVFTLREKHDGISNNLQLSLPYRNLGLAGRLTYGYDDRYFVEANFGYNGSERFDSGHRWGFFPSAGLGWMVSNEGFMLPYKETITKLKLKATYGLVGNDQIGSSNDRFFYMSEINMNNGDRGYTAGYDYGFSRAGISINRYSDPNITWEISRKTNFGAELNLWNEFEIQADFFHEYRSNILQRRSDIPTTMGLEVTPSANIGEAASHGCEFSVDYTKSFSSKLWMILRGNFTYATSEYKVFEEPDYKDTPWRSHVGQSVSQQWGYVAERLFIDEEEVANAPTQFDNYLAGDIKYKDINGDMIIDEKDQVPIGYPTTPEINYGFGLSLGFGKIDFSCFFQGSARSSFWIDPNATAPFVTNGVDGFTTTRAMLQVYADSHWSEDNRDIFALWPRLSESTINNNNKRNTWFMRDGSFLRLKTVELGYTVPKSFVEKCRLSNIRIYASGSNLAVFSAFKLWDPEMGGNGLAYPLQRVINLGATIDF